METLSERLLEQTGIHVDQRQVFGEFELDLVWDQAPGSCLDSSIEDVSWVRPFATRADAAGGHARCAEKGLNKAIEFCGIVRYCFHQRMGPSVLAHDRHRLPDACRTPDRRQPRAR